VDEGVIPAEVRVQPPMYAKVPVGLIPSFAGAFIRQGYRVVLRVSDDGRTADVWSWRD
jgi:hypothetical protein